MGILGIQLIGIMFGVFMVYLTFLNHKQNKLTVKEWMVWLGIWVMFEVVTLFPSILNPVLETLNLYRAMDFYISLGFLFLIFITFYIYSTLRSLQQKVEAVVRNIAFETTSIGEEKHGRKTKMKKAVSAKR